MKKSILIFIMITMIVVLFACGEDKNNPTEPTKNANIISIVPKSAFVGDTITIVGTNFGVSQGTGFVSFAGTKATDYTSWSDNEIIIKVPLEAKSGKLWLEVNDEKSNEVDFNILVRNIANIISISPDSAAIGEIITVLGTNFGVTRGSSYVAFNGKEAIEYIKWLNTEIKVKVPKGAESGKLWFSLKGVKSNEVDFTIVIRKANITSIKPKTAFVGDVITVIGTNFGVIQGTSYVSFAGTKATEYISWNENEIVVKVPSEANIGNLWLVVDGDKRNEVDFILKELSKEFGTVTDIEGQVYKTVKIGNQWWMAENLNVIRYSNGDTLMHDKQGWDLWYSSSANGIGSCCRYYLNSSLGDIYGRLYNWHAVNDPRGLAPKGWHVATDAEWTELTNYLGGQDVAGARLKDTGTTHWLSPNAGATNASSFNALPGGYLDYVRDFRALNYYGYWWTATEKNKTNVWLRTLNYNFPRIDKSAGEKVLGFSVRCVKD